MPVFASLAFCVLPDIS